MPPEDTIVLNVKRRDPEGRTRNFLLLFAEGRATEIEIPLSLDRLVGK